MKKHFCDICERELTSEAGHEHITVDLGTRGEKLSKELCAGCAIEFRADLRRTFGEVDWTIPQAGSLYGGRP